MIITQGLINNDDNYTTNYSYFNHKDYGAKVFNKSFLKNTDGRYEGFPFRTYSYGKFINGYSDHFPVYLYLVKEIK